MSIADSWDFPYAPLTPVAAGDAGGERDVVVATSKRTSGEAIADALDRLHAEIVVEPLVERAPIFWYRVESTTAATLVAFESALEAAGIDVRYVASATRGSLLLPPALGYDDAPPVRADAWRARELAADAVADAEWDGRWFLRDDAGGVAVRRDVCGTGAGTRLAVIDDDAAEHERLLLDDLVLVNIDVLSCATSHGALMVGWATSCRTQGGRTFSGVAPGASPRLYCIPKPGRDVVSLPLAIVRACKDGADVILCATYVEGTTSPMLDDALDFAWRLGRRGRGAAVVLPTGREASSPAGAVHSSWSLSFGDPASDPRVFCVGPSARGEGWFLWRDKKGKLRPFANRGPSVRWLAPGDDLAYPFSDRERLFHAESSGASAVAAGVLLLVLASNPALRVSELDAILSLTTADVPPVHDRRLTPLADAADVLPGARDRDRHNAKHGYGRMDARDACMTAADPICGALVAMGERDAALRFAELLKREAPYPQRLARWAARAMLADATSDHALRAILRHGRLLAHHPERIAAQPEGALARQVLVLFRRLRDASTLPRTRAVRLALDALIARFEPAAKAHAHTLERAIVRTAELLWPATDARRARDSGEDGADADPTRSSSAEGPSGGDDVFL